MKTVTLYRVYNYTDDCSVGMFLDFDDAEVRLNEYVSNYGEPVEVAVEPVLHFRADWTLHLDD